MFYQRKLGSIKAAESLKASGPTMEDIFVDVSRIGFYSRILLFAVRDIWACIE